MVHICCVDVNGPAVEINEREIKIQNLSFCKSILTFFGLAIKKLKITQRPYVGVKRNGDFVREVARFINANCSGVIEFEFRNCSKAFFPSLKKSQLTVKIVHFYNCSFGKQVNSLRKWFPNVAKIKFSGQNCIDNMYIFAIEFPCLEHLDISIPYAGKNAITTNNLDDMLKSNTNLRSLSIAGGVNAAFLQSVSKYLNELKCLEIVWSKQFYNPYNSTERVQIHLKNVKKLKIYYMDNNMDVPMIPITFDALEEFSIEKESYRHSTAGLGPELTKFIRAQGNLRKLHVTSYTTHLYEPFGSTCMTWNVSNKMALALPLLVEANLKYCIFTVDEIVQFINKCPLLRKFIVRIKRNEYDGLKTHTNNKWNTTLNEELSQITMERMD